MSLNKSNIFFNIISEYRDKGAKAAEKSFLGLEGTAAKLGKTIAGAFAADKIIAFGKSSVTAFTQANKQFTVMNQTLNNLGLNVGMTRLEDFFNKLELQFGKDKSVLIPAFQTLINSTKNYTKSQELLNLALDVSAGTGKDLETVSLALGKAYVGQTTSIVKLGVGFSAANLKGKTFLDIQKQLTAQFSGSAAQAANTFQGKLDKLTVGYDNMKEAIGKGLVTALTTAAGKAGDIDNLTKSMVKFGEETAKVAEFLGTIVGAISKVAGFFFSVKDNGQPKFSKYFGGSVSKLTSNEQQNMALAKSFEVQRQREQRQADEIAKKQAAATTAELAKQRALTAEKKKQLQAEKDKLALGKASALLGQVSDVFDLTAIERYAALQQATNEADRARLKLMGDIDALQKAIASGNANLATQIADTVKMDLYNLSLLQGGLNNIKSPDNPLKSLIDDIYKAIEAMKLLALAAKEAMAIAAGTFYRSSTGETSDTTMGSWGQYYKGLSGGLYGSTPAVVNQTTYNIAGTVVSDQMLSQTLANNNASGINSNINRLNVTYA